MNIEPLRLYVDPDLIAEGLDYVLILYPFWGTIHKKETPYNEKTVSDHGFDKRYATLVSSIDESEYVLVPHDYWHIKEKHPELLHRIVEKAQAHEKPLLIDASGDRHGEVKIPHSRVLRINQYRFDLPAHEITMPIPCEDLLESYAGGLFVEREKREIPSVGFVGWGSVHFKQRVRTFIKEIPLRILILLKSHYKVYKKGVFWREKAINIMQASSLVDSQFIIRSSYSGHTNTLKGDPQKNRQEFVANILNSDYTLIIRGDANAATRFYETLSLGRIPLFLDTACVLPLEDVIDYKEFCVFVDYSDIHDLPKILADFHYSLSTEQFIAMQRKARYVFEHYLRYDSFSPYLVQALRENKPSA